VAAELQVDVDALLDRRQPQLFQPAGLDLGEALVLEVRQGQTAPERERFSQLRGGAGEIACPTRGARLLPEALESVQVQLRGLELQHVAGRPGHELLARQQLAQPGDVPMQRGRRGLRRLVAPELVDQAVGGDDLVGVEQEKREEGAALPASELERTVAIEHLERPEQPKLHAMPPSGPPRRLHANTEASARK